VSDAFSNVQVWSADASVCICVCGDVGREVIRLTHSQGNLIQGQGPYLLLTPYTHGVLHVDCEGPCAVTRTNPLLAVRWWFHVYQLRAFDRMSCCPQVGTCAHCTHYTLTHGDRNARRSAQKPQVYSAHASQHRLPCHPDFAAPYSASNQLRWWTNSARARRQLASNMCGCCHWGHLRCQLHPRWYRVSELHVHGPMGYDIYWTLQR
jgi:hypothetical protein